MTNRFGIRKTELNLGLAKLVTHCAFTVVDAILLATLGTKFSWCFESRLRMRCKVRSKDFVVAEYFTVNRTTVLYVSHTHTKPVKSGARLLFQRPCTRTFLSFRFFHTARKMSICISRNKAQFAQPLFINRTISSYPYLLI